MAWMTSRAEGLARSSSDESSTPETSSWLAVTSSPSTGAVGAMGETALPSADSAPASLLSNETPPLRLTAGQNSTS